MNVGVKCPACGTDFIVMPSELYGGGRGERRSARRGALSRCVRDDFPPFVVLLG
jgi:hypothetical protein